MTTPLDFHAVGRLPAPVDNVAIATRILPAGTPIAYQDSVFTLSHNILEGHRFAVHPITAGEMLTSWGLPFGTALRDIVAGEYVCNPAMLTSLSHRSLDFSLPPQPNFSDDIPPFIFDEAAFSPAPPPTLYTEQRIFMGFPREGQRGTGTRNFIVLLGTSALTAGFVRALEAHLKSIAAQYPHIDGIIAAAHTEGGHRQPNNRDLLLRTLAGFMVNPNVGAVLAVDLGSEAITNAMLQEYMQANGYPLQAVPHHFMSLSGSFETSREAAAAIITQWLEPLNATPRRETPVSELKIGLQCGGSDAFSGISGNPLAGWITREIVNYGGSANLAETDELVSAETYVLDKVRDLATAQKFLGMLDRFKTWLGWHGQSISGNPSGGNLYRGLYNIYLKSLGAATKKNPDVRLDYVIDYGELMRASGFYFMDSPGNDLESVAGQVAAGCNMIIFVTGNGSITNFPFVPTIKIVTTSQRYQLLSNEMDINAGAYLDGSPMDELGAVALDLCINAASGQWTVGEIAGHAQVQIWRDWRLSGQVNLENIRPPRRESRPLPILDGSPPPTIPLSLYDTPRGLVSDQIGLILPTSLCAGQVARLIAEQLTASGLGREQGISRFVGLAHTEGCGAAGMTEYMDTVMGYVRHPWVAHCLMLEHGCEITHNGYMRSAMTSAGLDMEQFGWASIQLDGGIQAVEDKAAAWFRGQITRTNKPRIVSSGWGSVRLALLTQGNIPDSLAHNFATLTRQIVTAGGSIFIPANDGLVQATTYTDLVIGQHAIHPTLNYAQVPLESGLHIMETPSEQWSETLTGLGACGVEIMLAYTEAAPLQSHPFIPVLYISGNADADIPLNESSLAQITEKLAATLSRNYTPHLNQVGNVAFQITRGWLGVSV